MIDEMSKEDIRKRAAHAQAWGPWAYHGNADPPYLDYARAPFRFIIGEYIDDESAGRRRIGGDTSCLDDFLPYGSLPVR
jgi:hypothetical protein